MNRLATGRDAGARTRAVGGLALVALVASLVFAQASPAASRGPDFLRAFGAISLSKCTTACQRGMSGPDAGQMLFPAGAAVSGSGDVYVADENNERVDEFTGTGDFVRAFGGGVNPDGSDICTAATGCQAGSGATRYLGVAVTGTGDVYAVGPDSDRVDEYTQSGSFVRAFGKSVDPGGGDVCAGPTLNDCNTGDTGTDAGELTNPSGVAVAASGDVYVADTGNNRVGEYTTAGVFIRAFGNAVNATDNSDVCTDADGCQAGTDGNGAGEIPGAFAIGVAAGDVYVSDTNDEVDEYTQAGAYVSRFGTSGSGAGQFSAVTGVAVAGSGDVYVADDGNRRIDEFTGSGTFVRGFGKGVNQTDGSETCTTLSGCDAGTFGYGAGQAMPFGIAVTGSGDVYAPNGNGSRVDEFTQAGAFVRAFGDGVGLQPFDCTTASGCQAGGPGGGAGQFNGPSGVSVGPSGDVFVADDVNNRIDVFNSTGGFEMAFGSSVGGPGVNTCTTSCTSGVQGAGAGQFHSPATLAVAASGEVYVADRLNNRVDEYDPSGSFVRAFGKGVNSSDASDVCTEATGCQAGQQGAGAAALNGPQGIAVSSSGDVLVVDRLNNRIAVYSATGSFLRAFGKDVGGAGTDVCTTGCQSGTPGGDSGQLASPSGLAVSGSGEVFVGDQYNLRVDVFNQSGTFLRAFGKDVGGTGVDTCTSACQIGANGGAAGQLQPLSGLAVRGSGDVYVAEGNNRLDEFTQAGRFLRAFGKSVNVTDSSDVCTAASGCRMGDGGGDAGEFAGVFGVALNASGDIYIADYGNQRVDEYGPFANSAPVAAGDSYSTGQDHALTIGTPATGVLANDTDADGDPLTATGYTDPAHGTLTHNADGTFTYTPAAGFHGSDSFTYRASDGFSESSPATVTIAVAAAPPVPPAPVPPAAKRIKLAISHRHVPRVGHFVKVRLLCRGTAGAHCAGTLALDLTKDKSRLKASVARTGRDGHAKFKVATGKDVTVRIKASSRLLKALRRKRRVVVMATAKFTGGNGKLQTVRRKLTVFN